MCAAKGARNRVETKKKKSETKTACYYVKWVLLAPE